MQSADRSGASVHAEADWPPVLRWDEVANGDAPGAPEAAAWVARERDALRRQLDRDGALVLRGFGVATAEDFDGVVEAFGAGPFSYAESLSNAVRVELTPRVFTANEAPPEAVIHLHHELAQTPHFPTHLFFFCLRPADVGGATVLCRSDALYERLTETRREFATACEERGLAYTVRMPGSDDAGSGQGRSWRSTFGVATRAEAEAAMERLGYRHRWEADDSLLATSPVLPAVRATPGGRKAFFNQLIAAATGWQGSDVPPVAFGDGGAIAREDVEAVVALAEQASVDVAWQRGDVGLVDNRAVMHGRRHFEGERRVLAAFGVEA